MVPELHQLLIAASQLVAQRIELVFLAPLDRTERSFE